MTDGISPAYASVCRLSAAIDAALDADLLAEERAFRDLSARLQMRINRLTADAFQPIGVAANRVVAGLGKTHTARIAASVQTILDAAE